MSPNSLANLTGPPYGAPGGGRSGRVSAGQSIIEHMNTMRDWPLLRIEAVADDAAAGCSKRQAAKSLVRSMSDDWAKNGKPHAADDLDRVLDRTDGKAVQRVQVDTREVKDPAALRVELLRVLGDHPELLESLRAMGGGALLAEGGDPQTDAGE